MSLKSAFNQILSLHSREMTIEKQDFTSTAIIKVSPSNYFRNLSLPEEIIAEGFEFVITKESLGDFGEIKRGDRLIDTELGVNTISFVRPMFDFGGQIMGYRVRTS